MKRLRAAILALVLILGVVGVVSTNMACLGTALQLRPTCAARWRDSRLARWSRRCSRAVRM